jgi:hypothetical protein
MYATHAALIVESLVSKHLVILDFHIRRLEQTPRKVAFTGRKGNRAMRRLGAYGRW